MLTVNIISPLLYDLYFGKREGLKEAISQDVRALTWEINEYWYETGWELTNREIVGGLYD
jgi:hypothetical protein